MKKTVFISILFVSIILGCNTNDQQTKEVKIQKTKNEILINDSVIEQIDMHTQEEKVPFNPGKPVLTFIGEQIINDSIKLKHNYTIRIEIPGIPDSLISVGITNGKISRTHQPYEFIVLPNGIGVMGFSIGFKDSLNSQLTNHISEELIFIK
jgi:hypothetical protein